MATIEHFEVTTIGSRLVYGRDHDTSQRGQRRVCFRRHNDVLLQEGEVITIEYEYEQPGGERLPRLLVGVTTVGRPSP